MIKLRLSLIMFFQFLMYAVWWVPFVAYLTNMNAGSKRNLIKYFNPATWLMILLGSLNNE